jgi:uncharacterized protein YciI
MNSMLRFVALAVALSLSLTSCRSTGSSGARSNDRWVLVFLVTGPEVTNKSATEHQELQTAHLANIGKLADEDKLVVAGPFVKARPWPEARGIFILDTREISQAREWTSSDPMVQAGVLRMELAPLESSAPLRRSLELYREREAAAKAEGRTLKLEETVRPYVMLLAQDAAAAEKAVAALRRDRKVVMEGRLEGSPRGKYVVVIDAPDVPTVEEALGRERDTLGDHTLASWYASLTLKEMNEPGR